MKKIISILMLLIASTTFIATSQAAECVIDNEIEEVAVTCEENDEPGFCVVREKDHPEVEYESVCINE
jgi:hypothetical protein